VTFSKTKYQSMPTIDNFRLSVTDICYTNKKYGPRLIAGIGNTLL